MGFISVFGVSGTLRNLGAEVWSIAQSHPRPWKKKKNHDAGVFVCQVRRFKDCCTYCPTFPPVFSKPSCINNQRPCCTRQAHLGSFRPPLGLMKAWLMFACGPPASGFRSGFEAWPCIIDTSTGAALSTFVKFYGPESFSTAHKQLFVIEPPNPALSRRLQSLLLDSRRHAVATSSSSQRQRPPALCCTIPWGSKYTNNTY